MVLFFFVYLHLKNRGYDTRNKDKEFSVVQGGSYF